MALLINEYPWLGRLLAAAEKAAATRRMLDELHAAGAPRRILLTAATLQQQADAALSAALSRIDAEGIEPREGLTAYEKLSEAAGAEP